MKSLKINENEGLEFAKISGDRNLIHIDKSAGYNSLFGHPIIHGVLIIIKFLKSIKYDNNFKIIEIMFKEAFKYNVDITITKIKKDKNYNFILKQNNNICANINLIFFEKKIKINHLNKVNFSKIYINKNKKNKFSNKYIDPDLLTSLMFLSKYVGNEYPGKNSLISEIKINKIDNQNYKKISIKSFLIDKRFPMINNSLLNKNYLINFKTLIRPKLEIKLDNPNQKVTKKINSIKNNIFIIGASSGIGKDLLELFIINKNIKIIGTYFQNKINLKKENLISYKIDVQKDLDKIFRIIKMYSPLNIYYFPTPKINIRSNDTELTKLYKNYYIQFPLKILKFSNKYNNNFFYPSTTFINKKKFSNYAKIKFQAEKRINKLKLKKINISILRIPEINTKQNLSLIDKKLKNFRNLLNSDQSILEKVFFK
tara:strand:+ start:200 stop:1480 length:1281 start_codon:yes stop_codon:yes gene_type:complete